jgi:photosystem II stability/assembly factor-like uncharacterized protein
MRVWAVLIICACGSSESVVKDEAPTPRVPEEESPPIVEKKAVPEWRLEASGAREDTSFRVDVVAYAEKARAHANWSESSQWMVEAMTDGQPMKRLVFAPARVEERTDTGEVVVRFSVYFEPPTGKASVDLKVAPPGGPEEKVSLEIEEAETWHRLQAAGGPRAFVEGSFAVAGGKLLAVDGKQLLRSTDGGKSWQPAPGMPAGEVAQSIVTAGDHAVLATSKGLWESNDAQSWKKLLRPIPRRKLLLEAGGKRLVAVADRRVVFCSVDGGKWQRAAKGLPPGRVLDVAVAGKAVLVAAVARGKETIFRSADGCKTFKAVGRGGSVAADGEMAVAGAGDVAFRSDDGGVRWEEIPAPGPAGTYHLAVLAGQPLAALLDQNFPCALVRLDRSSWLRVKRGGLPRVKAAPTLFPAGDTLYLVADRTQLWSLEARLVR